MTIQWHCRVWLTGMLMLMGVLPAMAQDQQATAGRTEQIQEVVVTGTMLRSSAATVGSQLVTTMTAEDLLRNGSNNAVQALATITQNQQTVVSTTQVGAGTGFAAYANLRSLGSENTLVLFNGKRIVNNPYQSRAVNLNTIPLAMLERVEVLSDGASSIYGSDAIAGVINYIPKRDYEGASAWVTGTQPAESGGRSQAASLSLGYGSLTDRGWNVMGGVSYNHQFRLSSKDRSETNTGFLPGKGQTAGIQDRPFPANYSQGTALARINPTSPTCNPPNSPFLNGLFGPQSCAFDFAPFTEQIGDQKDISGLVRGSLSLGQNHTLSLEYLVGRSEVGSQIAPPNIRGATLPPTNPFFPGNGITPATAGLNPALPVVLSARFVPSGPSESGSEDTTDRVMMELQGRLGESEYEAWLYRSTANVDVTFIDGIVDANRLADGFHGRNGAPFLNPFGPQTEAGAAYIESIKLQGRAQTAESVLEVAGVQASHALFDLPAGSVEAALALEYKSETAHFVTEPLAGRSGGLAALGANFLQTGLEASGNAAGSRYAYSITGETSIPLLRKLNLNGSVRYDHSSDFGGTVNPKVLLSYEPVPWFELRGSYNTGFRAPTLYNVFAPQQLQLGVQRRNDPVLCPGGVVNTGAGGIASRDCPSQFQGRTGGNPDLQPEKSDAFSFGLTVKPLDSLALGLDYWNYRLDGVIAPLSDSAIFGDLARFGALVTRCSQVDPALVLLTTNCSLNPGVGDPIAYVDQRSLNLGTTKTSGVDGKLEWKGPQWKWGQPIVSYRGTVALNYEFQRQPGGEFFSRRARFTDGFPVFGYSHYVSLGWDTESWSARLSNRRLGSYEDCNAQCNINPAFFQSVKPYSVSELAAQYRGIRHTILMARVSNLFDDKPPFTNAETDGVDSRFASALGRTYSLTLQLDY